MIRRRRPQREIPFSFDSFLDVVANVVGIILRLILVAWVGARSYHGPAAPPPPPPDVREETADAVEPPPPPDPLADAVARRRQELAAAEDRLHDQVKQLEQAKDRHARAEMELSAASARVQTLRVERTTAQHTAADKGTEVRTAALTLPEIDSRVKQVSAEIDALKSLPLARKSLRYRTPVSQALQTEELFFECHAGRVAVIDVGAMLEEMHRERGEKAKALATQWEVEGVTAPVGAFRMRYTLERERGPIDGPAGAAPAPEAEFSYSASWVMEPVNGDRGEREEAALAQGSDFHKVVDVLDPKVTAVTFWVYSDSFPLYRRLRDYLHERGFVVAGRPLLEGMPIGSSRHGTASRGQ